MGGRRLQYRLLSGAGPIRRGHAPRGPRTPRRRAQRLPPPVPRPQRTGPPPPHVQGARPGRRIAGARSLGIEPVGIDTRYPEWQEAFLHPKQAFGIMVQLAQSSGGWTSSRLPPCRRRSPTSRPRLPMWCSWSPTSGRHRAVPGPARRARHPAAGGAERRRRDIGWPGPGRIRLAATGTRHRRGGVARRSDGPPSPSGLHRQPSRRRHRHRAARP